ncbi:hypothetical protein BT96DRAFT_815714, partial [Gymnopus androsaceus JB14]
MKDLGEEHHFLQFPHSPAPEEFQELHRLAWKQQAITKLFHTPMTQWRSLRNPQVLRIPPILHRQPSHILVLKEYEIVYKDMEQFFSGQTLFITPFDEEDANWARW